MNIEVVAGRYFREKLAYDIMVDFPQIVDDYKNGLVARQIEEKYNFSNYFDVDYGKNIETAILMALGGYESLNGNLVDGLLPKLEYKQIALKNQRTKGVSKYVRVQRANLANNKKFEKLGILPYSDEEKYFIWLAIYDVSLKDNRGRIQRSNLTKLINEEFHNSNTVRKSENIRNIITTLSKSRKIRNSLCIF